MLVLLDFHVLFVEMYAVLEDPHAVVENHVLDGLFVDARDICFYQCYFVGIDFLHVHSAARLVFSQDVQENFS